jgi:hypothetical protein
MPGPFSKLNIHSVRQQMKQYVYSIPSDCGRWYIGICIKEHKYNLTQGLLKKSKLTEHAYEEGHKICWKEAKVLQIEPNTPTFLWQII